MTTDSSQAFTARPLSMMGDPAVIAAAHERMASLASAVHRPLDKSVLPPSAQALAAMDELEREVEDDEDLADAIDTTYDGTEFGALN